VLDIFKVLVSGVKVFVAKDIVSKDVDCGHKPLSPCFIGSPIFSGTFHCLKKSLALLLHITYVFECQSHELCGVSLD